MNILVLNSGSSSIKYQIFKMPEAEVICSGLVERIGQENAEIHFSTTNFSKDETLPIPNHKTGLEKVVSWLLDKDFGVIKSTDEIDAVGHRVVHGGSSFTNTTVITDKVKAKIKNLFSLAPLHNPHNYEGIEVAEGIFKNARQIAVFDTAFFQSIPEQAHRYAIPTKWYKEHKIRMYGFHGTSHKYVSEMTAAFLGATASKIITVHLGNGCSITAVQNGKAVDHSLGFSPINGLIMGTRSGDIDHSMIFHLVNNLGFDLNEVNSTLQKQSGMLGLTGHSDLRDIESKASEGDKDCQLALHMNTYRIKKYIGAYAAAMNGVDAVVFTAGIGENSDTIRGLVCEDMEYLGIDLDQKINSERSKEIRIISTATSRVKVLVIPTNEELEIAKQSFKLIN